MKPNKIALITGASSGIGQEFAEQLAEKGYNLIITARRAERLNQLANRLEETRNVKVTVVPADLSAETDLQMLEKLIATSERLDLLVNNAGFGVHKSFAKGDSESWQRMITVHITALNRLVYAAIPLMKKQGGGHIINVSSLAGIIAGAGAVYSGTKAYMNTFSRLLQRELKSDNIKVQALCPGFTYTEFHDTETYGDWNRKEVPRLLWMSAKRVVRISLKTMDRNRVIVVPGLINSFMALFNDLFTWVAGFAVKRTNFK